MKNIILSADEALLEAAQLRAAAKRTTLDEQVRERLRVYVRHEQRMETAMVTITELREHLHARGRRFSREEMNER